MRRLPLRIAIVSALAALAWAAAPATAAPPRAFYGVNVDARSSSTDLERLGRVRAGQVRVALGWRLVEPTRGAKRDWSGFDRFMERAAGAGLRVLPVLSGVPPFVGAPNDPPRKRADRAAFALFARDAVRRYGTRGAFWAERPQLTYRPIRWWEVLNEPNLPVFWNGRPNPRQYATVLAETARAIRGADPAAKIMLGGLTYATGRNADEFYLAALYRISRARLYFDRVAIHPYSREVSGVQGSVTRIRAVMNRAGDRRTAIAIGEIGWATGFQGAFNSSSPGGQARHLSRTYTAMARRRGRDRVSEVVWWNLRDGPRKTDFWGDYTGMLNSDGSPKPSWRTFSRLTRAAR